MGCFTSIPRNVRGKRRRLKSLGKLAVFSPGFRIPIGIDFTKPLGDSLPKSLVDRLSALRTRIAAMAVHVAATAMKLKWKMIKRNGASTFSNLLLALEGYLPVLLGLAKDGNKLKDKVQFVWFNQEDDDEKTAIADVWYEVLSVLHLMAMTCLAEANYLLLPRKYNDGYQQKASEENRRRSIDVLLKAAGYLDCAIHNVLPMISLEFKRSLPVDLSEGELCALCMQALGQGVDIQLGMAIDSSKATLAVKRRLACEMVKYWLQAQDSIITIPFSCGWGEKHRLFVKWKYTEAKAAAYYFHGLILDEGNTDKSHKIAVAALRAAEQFLKDSKSTCEVFNATPPTSRSPPLWGLMTYLSDKIPKAILNLHLSSQERMLQAAPPLPDFALALKPDDYQLPALDPIWNTVISTTEDLKAKEHCNPL